jgi:hypothetical protein
VTVPEAVTRSLDRRIGEPGTASKYPRGDHPSPREVAIQACLGQHVEEMHAWSLGDDVQGTAPASVGAASRVLNVLCAVGLVEGHDADFAPLNRH